MATPLPASLATRHFDTLGKTWIAHIHRRRSDGARIGLTFPLGEEGWGAIVWPTAESFPSFAAAATSREAAQRLVDLTYAARAAYDRRCSAVHRDKRPWHACRHDQVCYGQGHYLLVLPLGDEFAWLLWIGGEHSPRVCGVASSKRFAQQQAHAVFQAHAGLSGGSV